MRLKLLHGSFIWGWSLSTLLQFALVHSLTYVTTVALVFAAPRGLLGPLSLSLSTAWNSYPKESF